MKFKKIAFTAFSGNHKKKFFYELPIDRIQPYTLCINERFYNYVFAGTRKEFLKLHNANNVAELKQSSMRVTKSEYQRLNVVWLKFQAHPRSSEWKEVQNAN